jgi:hypothetical protein
MSSDVIKNWDKILHKNVRSKDMDGVGNVVAINDDDSISITTQGSQHIYKIPKSNIEGYNGAEVLLDLAAAEISKYDINSKSQDNTQDTITTTTTSTTAATKSATETLSRPTLPRTQVKTSTSIIEKRTESPATTEIASGLTPVIIDNKSSTPNQASKTKRREAEDKARREAEDKARREADAIEHATITTKESIEPLPQQQTIRQQNLLRSKENTNNYLRNDDLDPVSANMTSWQYSTVAWINMYKEFAINAAKLSEYWFNLFWSPWAKDKNILRK